MKPKNKFQKQIFDASKKLKPVTETQYNWAYKNCFEHYGHRNKKGIISCLECGHQWTDKTIQKCKCPQCDTRIKINDTRKRTFKTYEYLCIITVCNGFQVLRFFYVQQGLKVGKKADYFLSEVVQRWIAPDGKHATIAKLRPMGFWVETWNFSSDLEIRPNRPLYNVAPTCIYPYQQLLPEIERSGYNKKFFTLTPFDMFSAILRDNKSETLLKTGQYELFRYFALDTSNKIQHYWYPIRICIRNNYIVKDASLWCDYINLLSYFEKDLCSPKYTCPADLNAEHDKYHKKKLKQIE